MSRLLQVIFLSSLRASTQLHTHPSIYPHRSFSMTGGVSISDAFDGGNIEHIGTEENNDTLKVVRLKIKKDPYTELEQTNHFQSFSFRSIASGKVKYVIENAGEASYTEGWKDYTVFFSRGLNNPYDWERQLDTSYDEDGTLSWTQEGSGYFCYFPPYSYNRHLDLIAKCGNDSFSLGKTLDGRDIDCVKLGGGDKICWIIHRQHPGESMAEYFAEGLIERLLGINGSVDGLVTSLLKKYTFYIVPNMCIDGSIRGHLRTNAGGHNLNREWAPSSYKNNGTYYEAPTLTRSPEVHHVLRKMDETGVDAFFDIHGDEALPFNFLAGGEGLPNWNSRLKSLHGAFLASYERANSDIQKQYGYEPEEPKEGMLNICSNQIGHRFDCLSATLEMPFKDCLTNPDPERGWSPARAKQLGASILNPLSYVYPYLRDETSFWTELPKEDEYICPSPKYQNEDSLV